MVLSLLGVQWGHASSIQGYDHTKLRVSFDFNVFGLHLSLPSTRWEMALPIGGELYDLFPPSMNSRHWTESGASGRQ
eukprot:426816-Amphidinium_carterae.1